MRFVADLNCNSNCNTEGSYFLNVISVSLRQNILLIFARARAAHYRFNGSSKPVLTAIPRSYGNAVMTTTEPKHPSILPKTISGFLCILKRSRFESFGEILNGRLESDGNELN